MKLLLNTQLENEDLILQELSDAHLDDLGEIAEKYPDLLKFSPTLFGSKEAIENMIRQSRIDRLSGNRITFAIYSKALKKFVGSSSFGNISLKDERLEIGWTWISPEVQGTGFNKKFKETMLTYAFEELKIKRLEFKTDLRNTQSQKAIEKLGATKEGILRSHTLMLDGHRRDTVYYSILANEWPEIKANIFGK